jgi:Fic family protein
MDTKALAQELLFQKEQGIDGNLYWKTQIEFAYNSNRIEGSSLTQRQTRWLFETKSLSGTAAVDDALEARNHFRMFDYMLETVFDGITTTRIKKMHRILKSGVMDTDDAELGDWKHTINAIGGFITAPPQAVEEEINRLLNRLYSYRARGNTIGLEQVAAFHHGFELIHPFVDGNGRIGRMLLFSLCMEQGVLPFIVLDSNRQSYYEGLEAFSSDSTQLVQLFASEQQAYSSDIEFFLAGHTADEDYLNLKLLPDGFSSIEPKLRENERWFDDS